MKGEIVALPLHEGAWQLDMAHSTVEFGVRHLGISRVRGSFQKFAASIFVGADLATTRFSADVDLSSVSTGNADRDNHLRSSDFFNLANHPTMTFASKSIEERPDGTYLLVGDLSINGRTRPQELALEFHGLATVPMDGTTHAGFAATGALSRKDFGVDFDIPMVAGGMVIGDKVTIALDVEISPVRAPDRTGSDLSPSALAAT